MKPLTMRQWQVAQCIARGLTNKEIARELGLSIGSVKIHASHAIGALGASCRLGVAVAVLRGQARLRE
jgi:two-component system nitrate/nitrite response regulator NarL